MTPESPQSTAAPAPGLTPADALLEEMAAAGREAPLAARLGGTGRPQSTDAVSILDRPTNTKWTAGPKMRYSHEAMIDLMLAQPGITQTELAATFGYSAPWISVVVNSDAFKALYAQRRHDLVDPELMATVKQRLETVAAQSLRVLSEKLAQPMVPDELALRAAELSTKALGFGARQAANVQVNVTSESRISNLAHRLIALRQGAQAADVTDV